MARPRRIPRYTRHDYMARQTSNFFTIRSAFKFITMDRLKLVDQMLLSVRYRCAIPRALLMDPTSRCNLRCTGCWASGYQRDDLPFELMDRILTEAESLRVRYCFLSGGEPLIRKDDLLSLIEKHPRISFCAYTNGLLIDEAFADRMTELGNLSVSLSLEGFREQTDARRGPGVYDRVMETMDLLRQRGLSFSFSACYHSGNYETVSSDAFLDWMREKGCGAGWLFTYIPVGSDADMRLVCTASQRAHVQERIADYRRRHAMALIDFWNNGHLAAGCVGAGEGFVHINARGDVEPCAFSHYSDFNIRNGSLLDALRSPFLTAYRRAAPFHPNPLRSCPLIDVPDALVRVVREAGAHSTELNAPEAPEALADKLRPVAEKWAPVADRLYRRFPPETRKMFEKISSIRRVRKGMRRDDSAPCGGREKTEPT